MVDAYTLCNVMGPKKPAIAATMATSIATPVGVGAKQKRPVGRPQDRGNPARGTPPPLRPAPVEPLIPALGGSTSSSSTCDNCELPVGRDSIGCDKCDKWYHPSPLCMGLSELVIEAIREAGGIGIEFICTHCRISPSPGSNMQGNPALSQLAVMVKSLCVAVAKLTDRVDHLSSQSQSVSPPQPSSTDEIRNLVREEMRSQSQSAPPLQPSSAEDIRNLIRDEISEMEERKKRRDSIVFRGIRADTDGDALVKIKEVVYRLLNFHPPLTNLHCINKEKGLYRVKVSDDDQRTQLLGVAKELRNVPEYRGVFVNKDLTYKQRQVLYERRQRQRLTVEPRTTHHTHHPISTPHTLSHPQPLDSSAPPQTSGPQPLPPNIPHQPQGPLTS